MDSVFIRSVNTSLRVDVATEMLVEVTVVEDQDLEVITVVLDNDTPVIVAHSKEEKEMRAFIVMAKVMRIVVERLF